MQRRNELQAICVQLPPDVCPTASAGSPRFLAITQDDDQPATVLGGGIPFIPAYQLIWQVCRHRAVLTVDGRLRIDGRVITPEVYLQRWRSALAQAVPIHRLPVERALRPVAVFVWQHTDAQRQIKPHWITPPYANFGELLDAHGQHTTTSILDGQPLTRLEIDLSAPHGARDAWWADDFLADQSRLTLSVSICGPDAALPAQPVVAGDFHQSAAATHPATATL